MKAIIETQQNYIKIRQATKQGYINLTDIPGCADLSYAKSKLRRGRVQEDGGVTPTLTGNGNAIYVFEEVY